MTTEPHQPAPAESDVTLEPVVLANVAIAHMDPAEVPGCTEHCAQLQLLALSQLHPQGPKEIVTHLSIDLCEQLGHGLLEIVAAARQAPPAAAPAPAKAVVPASISQMRQATAGARLADHLRG